MKNRNLILAFVLAMSLCMTACDNTTKDSENSSGSSSSSSSSSNEESNSSSSEESSSSAEESSSQPEQDNFPESFTGYLGETLYGKDAEEQVDKSLKFDGFTYLRWAIPIFDNTLKNPDLINWDTYEMPKYNEIKEQKNPGWFLVKPGDTLENGLKVKSACCIFRKCNFIDGTKVIMQTASEVTFENKLELTGILVCSGEPDGYIEKGDLFFFPDTTVNSKIPVICNNDYPDKFILKTCVIENKAFISDGMYFRLGNIDSASVNLDGIISKGGACEVKIVLDNIRLVTGFTKGLNGSFAKIVSIEKIGA